MATDPFKYLDQVRAQDNQPAAVDPFVADLQRQRDDETSFRLKVAKPDEAARAQQIARARGVPVSAIQGNLPAFEQEARASRAKAIMSDYPAIGHWSATPSNVAVAADDYDNLGLIGKAFYGIKNLASYAASSVPAFTSGAWGALAAAGENLDAIDITRDRGFEAMTGAKSIGRHVADFALARQSEGQGMMKGLQPKVDNWVARNLLQGVASLGTTAAAVGAGMVAGPTVGASVMGMSVGGNEYVKAREKGLSPARSAIYGTTQGLIETATEHLPVSMLIKDIAGKTPIVGVLMRQLAAEIPTEIMSTLGQNYTEWVTLNPTKTVGDFLAEQPMAVAETVLATIGGVGSTVALTKAAERTATITGKMLDKRAQAQAAGRQGTMLDGLHDAVTQSKLKARDPEALKSLLATLGEESGAENLFVPADAVQAYMQSEGYSGEFDRYSDHISEAIATGGDVVLPVDIVADLAGTPAWAALKPDMRLSAGGMSQNEAKTFDESMADVMDELSERAAAGTEAARTEQAPRDALRQSIADKLTNAGFTPSTAMTQAELLTQRASTRATRMGQTIVGDEFADVQVNQVLPPALAQIQASDSTDMLIETMKGGKDARTAAGPSLMEFISKGGGITDTGGDLKAMGADAWHKGKPGKRKLVRDSSGDGQSSMLAGGGLGVNEYSADAWANRAWEAGYFPDSTERPTANELLDAISDGVAGRDRYLTAKEKTLRDAAEELRGMLENRGVDPDTASRKDIKAAIAAYQKEAEGGASFDQAGTDTAAFKRWFGDSKVVDARGKPLVVYHGTNSDVEAFDPAKRGSQTRDQDAAQAFFFSRSTSVANDYSELGTGPANVIPAFLSLQNPMVEDVQGGPYQRDYFNDVIEQAQEAGRDGVIFRNVEDGVKEGNLADTFAVFEPTQIKSAIGNSGAFDPSDPRILYQSFNDGPRGRITFPAAGFGAGPSVIELFQARDQSTFLHETGHLWLEELRFDATDRDAPDQLKADWQTVQDWFAASGYAVTDGVIPVDAHEIWARGVERYLMEGKAPTPSLRKAFEAFKSWLVSIYRSVDRLKSPVTPEIRAVMDRLIATDEEIAAAAEAQNIEALFPDKPDTMSADEFAAYQASTLDARGAAHDALLAKVMGAVKRRVTKEYKDRRATVEADVTAKVDARPEFRALRQLKETPIDGEWVRETFGEDATSMLPKQVPPVHKDGGANPDEVAEQSGFTSGDEMVRTLMGVETARRQLREGGDLRSVRKALIDQEVDALMMERYGDPFTDGSIEEEALAIIHNDQQGEVIAAEMRVLARSTGQRVTPYRIAKDWAARSIRDGKVKDVASRSAITRYQRAAAKSAKAAMDAVISGDTAEAFRQKQAQMLNNALISEAKRAADEIEAAVKRMERVASKRTMLSVDQDYLERAQGLLEQVDLKRRTQRFDRQEGYEAWAREQEESGRDMATPPSFAATLGTTNWSRLTVDQLLGLDATVKQIMHLGRHKQKLLDAKEERDFEEVVADAIGGMDGIPMKPSGVSFDEPGYFNRAKSLVLGLDAAMLKMETVFDWLDQGKNGVFNRVVFQRFVDAQENRRLRIADMMGKLEDARQKIPEKVRKRWGSKVTLGMIDPETGRPAVMTRDKLIAMALNMGNEGNARKLAGGYGWNEQAILGALNTELTTEEWQFVQDSWDIIDTLWPDIAALERRLNGVEPDKVEAREVQTSAGLLRGGYYPVVYDPTRSLETEQQGAVSADKLFESGYRRANTRAGSTNERTKVERPVFLSLSVISRHIGEVVHDITHREAVIDAHRFLNDKRIIKEVRSRLGEHVQKQFNPWLQHIANEWASDAQGTAALEKMVKGLRTNATFVGMGFRVSTTVMQFAGLFNSAERVGSRWVAEGVFRLAKNPVQTMQFVLENSQEVAARVENMDRDIRDTIKREQSKLGYLSEAKQFAFYFIGMADRFVSTVTWIGAYNRALGESQTDNDAISYADKAVRQSQGAGAAKDLAAIQRGKGTAGEAGKLLTMFYSYMSAFYQRQRTLGRDYGTAVRTRSAKDLPGLLARTMLLYFFPALASELLAGRGPDDDKDETWATWAAWKIGLSALGPIPVLRDVVGGFASGFGYTFTPASGLGRSAVNTFKNAQRLIEGDETKRATRDALETAGYLGAPVPGQVAVATQFMVDVSAGEKDPQGFSDWWEGLTTGKIKED